jgi:hypothetical protein
MLKRIWLALAVMTAVVLGTVAVAAALNPGDTNPVDPPPQDTSEDEAPGQADLEEKDDQEPRKDMAFLAGVGKGFVVDEGFFFDDDWDEWDDFHDKDLPPGLIEEINSETDALVTHLTGLGFDVTIETDDNGLRHPVFTDDDDKALWQAIEDFEQSRFAAEAAAWTDEEKAEHNAWIDEFVADLAAEGVTVETEEIAPGVRDIIWTDELDKSLGVLHMGHFFDDEWEECKIELSDVDA